MFGDAAEAVVDGDLERLRLLLDCDPGLASARSADHGATLMHYVAANGPVEEDMQRTPLNAVEIAELLLSRGAEVDAIIDGERATTPLVSLVTSEFPAMAGLQAELVALFARHGAAVDGLDDDGYPLACAAMFGYPDAIASLLECGARVDNVVVAAALGRLDLVQQYVDGEGRLTDVGAPYPDPFMREVGPDDVLALALEHAREHGRPDVADYLVAVGVTAE